MVTITSTVTRRRAASETGVLMHLDLVLLAGGDEYCASFGGIKRPTPLKKFWTYVFSFWHELYLASDLVENSPGLRSLFSLVSFLFVSPRREAAYQAFQPATLVEKPRSCLGLPAEV